MQLREGSLLKKGEYRIERVLGQGGFGITYLGVQCGLNRRVAIKEFFMKEYCERGGDGTHVTIGTSGSRELVNRFREKFIKEAQMIAALSNPHIVSIHDVFEENGTAYYVMEYADGGSLQQKVEDSDHLSEATALRYACHLCDALSYIHGEKILHLDVKPSNILLNKKSEPVLIDFGISKRYDDEGGQTSSTPVGMSRGYAPLEQYDRGGVSSFSAATDVYSLGATLYFMLCGHRPAAANEVSEDGLSLDELRAKGVSPNTQSAIVAAMQPRRKDRPQSVEAFLKLLNENNKAQQEKNNEAIDEETITGTVVNDDETEVNNEVKQNVKYSDNKQFTVNGVTFTMVSVQGGTFTMGATAVQGSDAYDDEKPAHQVTLDSYHIGETEVTQALWQAVMGSNPSRFKGDNLPVENVSWNDCQAFIVKLNTKLSSQLSGRQFRLPTEAEWEYAARGGRRSQDCKYSGSNSIGKVAWYGDNSGDKTHTVKGKQPNELGLYDMNGNVWEWCADWYGSYSSSSQNNPKGASTGSSRVLRGGSWYSYARYCRVSFRNYFTPDNRNINNGLRLALR